MTARPDERDDSAGAHCRFRVVDQVPPLQRDAAARWSRESEKSRKSLTDWIIAEQTRNFSDANRLFDDLTWQIIQNNRTKGDGNLKWKPEPLVVK